MKLIALSRGRFAKVDNEDFDRISAHRWYAHWSRYTRSFYAVRHEKTNSEGKREFVQMHREVLGAGPGREVDHANHETLDNRRENLRVCSHSENQHNSRIRRDNASGFKGVSWSESSGRWRATIILKRKQIHLGYHDAKEDAARAYDLASSRLHGDFASPNSQAQYA